MTELHYNKKLKTIQDPVAADYLSRCQEKVDNRQMQLSMDGSVDPNNTLATSKINKIVEETIPIKKGRRFGMGKPSDLNYATPTFTQDTEHLQQQLTKLENEVVEKNKEIKTLGTLSAKMLRILKDKHPEEFASDSDSE